LAGSTPKNAPRPHVERSASMHLSWSDENEFPEPVSLNHLPTASANARGKRKKNNHPARD
jgi:hypothetical protein